MYDKQTILSKTQLPTITVNVPAWGGDVIVSTLSAIDSERMQQTWKNLGRPAGDWTGFGSWVVAHTVAAADGKRFFDPVKDFDSLCQQPAKVIAPLFDAACKLNALTKSDQDELVKN